MDFLRTTAGRSPHRTALDDGASVWSFAELDLTVDVLARALVAAEIGVGRRVALLLGNGASHVVALHAVPRAGCVLAPLNPRLTAPELATALAVLDPALVLAGSSTRALARQAVHEAGVSVPVLAVETLMEGSGGSPVETEGVRSGPEREVPPREWAVLWTSGTGGRARGVALTSENLHASALATRERLALGPDDRWHLSLSPAHMGGLALVTRAAIVGSAVVARGAFSARDFNALVDDGQVTHASLVPTMLQRVLEEREGRPFPPTLGCVLVGGARTAPALVRRALGAGIPVALTYGMTEASSQIATAPPAMVRENPETVGLPLGGVEVRVDGAGEILVRGPTVALGYVGSDRPLEDARGWLHTGDLGEVDAVGRLRVTGRRADRIVTGGVNVDPAEVEDVLRLHGGVQDVSVVGVPDTEWGEVVAAAVVRRPGSYPDPAELETLARARLSTSKIPRRFVFVQDLPRNPNGKVDRGAVRGLVDDPPPLPPNLP